MSTTITGTLHLKKATETVGTSNFQKREFVINTGGDYPQHVILQLTKDNCAKLDHIKVGQTITVHYNVRGREWTSPQGEIKYFNTLEAWKVDTTAQATPTNEPQPIGNTNDLPF